MDSLCPVVESSTETARDRLTLGSILRAFLPALLQLLKLGKHKLRVLWQLAACGTPVLGANLFACPHCQHRHWAPRSCGDRHCPRCMAAKSWQWLEKQTRSLLPITYYHCVFTLPAELHSLMLASQPAQTLSALVRLRRTESAGVRTQPTRRRSRNHRCLTYLGTETRLPSPSPLHCYRRSIKSGWQTVALAQTAKVPLSRASGCRAVPRQVPGRARSDA